MGHDKCLSTCALLGILFYEGVVTAYLPLVIVACPIFVMVASSALTSAGMSFIAVCAQVGCVEMMNSEKRQMMILL